MDALGTKTGVVVDSVKFIIGGGNVVQVHEEWREVDGFPLYEVSNLGRIANVTDDVLLRPSYTKQGALKVGLYSMDDHKQYTRSVKVLVAEAFVEGCTLVFNTPVLLDGDQDNCVAHNLVWRPRWFAWHYARQFRNIFEFYRLGPIVELDIDGIILGAYHDTVEVGVTNGLLFEHIWQGIHNRTGVFPTRQRFAFADKV